jgi:hypothetical protein
MARKAEVEHLRSADRQHYAGSRKLGDQPDTAHTRAATITTDQISEAFAEFEQATGTYNTMSGSDVARTGPAHPNWSTFEPKLTGAYIRGVDAANRWLDLAHPTFDEDAGEVAYTELVNQLADIDTDNTHTADAIAEARKLPASDAIEHLRLHIQMHAWRSTTKAEMIAAAEKQISQRDSRTSRRRTRTLTGPPWPANQKSNTSDQLTGSTTPDHANSATTNTPQPNASRRSTRHPPPHRPGSPRSGRPSPTTT